MWIEKWLVPSSSSNKEYVVSRDEKSNWGCSCPAWIFHRRICKHIRSIRSQSELLYSTAYWVQAAPRREVSNEFIEESEMLV